MTKKKSSPAELFPVSGLLGKLFGLLNKLSPKKK
jgi:hypothetical protein